MGFSARFVAVLPESVDSLRARLTSTGAATADEIEAAVKSAESLAEAVKTASFYDKVIRYTDEVEALQALEQHIYGGVREVAMVNGGAE